MMQLKTEETGIGTTRTWRSIRLFAARLALTMRMSPTEVRRHWMGACRLLVCVWLAQGCITIYELLDPLPSPDRYRPRARAYSRR